MFDGRTRKGDRDGLFDRWRARFDRIRGRQRWKWKRTDSGQSIVLRRKGEIGIDPIGSVDER
jgi:hypothetical protein